MSEADWNAVAYDELSDPMFEWGMAVLAALELKGNERVLDAGCGSGRLTEELLGRLPSGEVVALDYSPQMLEQARRRLERFGGRVEFAQASLHDFELAQKVDGIFSNAVFHWVADHAAMFRALHRALRQGGWLVAQFGGVGNLSRTLARAHEVAELDGFRQLLSGVEAGPHFENAESTRERMEGAGFLVSEAKLHTVAPVFERRERYEAFLETVVLRQFAARLSGTLRRDYLREVARRTWDEEGAYTLDYVRLTVRATS